MVAVGRRESHLRALAGEAGVEIVLDRSNPRDDAFFVPAALVEKRGGTYVERAYGSAMVFTEPAVYLSFANPRRQYPYFVGLHELGHANDPDLKPRPAWGLSETAMLEEVRAWRWAFEHALERPNETTLRSIFHTPGRSLRSYLDHRRDHKSITLFHDLLQEVTS